MSTKRSLQNVSVMAYEYLFGRGKWAKYTS